MLKSCHQGREGEGGEESLRELVGWDWGGTDGEQRRRYLDQGSHLFHYLLPNLPLLLNCMSSLFIKYHIASNVFRSYISVYDPQLENSWHIMGHTLKENCYFLPQKPSNVHSASVRIEGSYIPSPYDRLLTGLVLCGSSSVPSKSFCL